MSYGDELRIRRKKCGWSQANLARFAGVGINSITRWENNKSNPSKDSKKRLDDAIEARLAMMGEEGVNDTPTHKPKSELKINFVNEIDAAIKQAIASGGKNWHILILPLNGSLDFRVCADRSK